MEHKTENSASFHSKISTKPDLLGTFTGPLWIGSLQNMSVFTCVRCGSNGAGDGARHELRRGGCRSCQGAPAHPASPRHLSRQHVRCVNQSVSAHLPLRALLHVNADRVCVFVPRPQKDSSEWTPMCRCTDPVSPWESGQR